MKQACWKMVFIAVLTVLLQAWPAWAWDDCAELAKEGPNMARPEGKCAMAGPGKMGKDGKIIEAHIQCKDASGKIIEESQYRKGSRQSIWFNDAEGRKISFAFNAAEKLQGPVRAFGPNGSLLCEMNYAEGKQNGPVRESYPDGKLHRTYTVKNDLREGKFFEYGHDGKLALERYYDHGVDVMEKIYYPDGKLQEHSSRHPDGKSYTTKNYWPNGRLQSEASFEIKTKPACTVNESTRVGKAYKYAADGSLREEAKYDEIGRPDGAQIAIDEKGKRTETVYAKGKLAAKKVFSADGKLELAEVYNEDGSRK